MWNRAENQINNQVEFQIKIVFIRHGATRSNLEHRYLGKSEEALCEQGINQLKRQVAEGSYPKVDLLFFSPLKRCKETAAILYPDREGYEIEEFSETDFGLFEGKNYEELNGDPLYQAWIDSNGTLPFPEGESREDFSDRCAAGIKRLVNITKNWMESKKVSECSVGCIVHGGTIMALGERFAEGNYYDYQVAPGEGYLGVLKTGNEAMKINFERKCGKCKQS